MLDPYKLTETEEEQRRGLKQQFIGIIIIISITHFIINFMYSPPPQYIVWGYGTSYFSKIIGFIGETFQSISFINIISSMIVLLFGFFIKRKIHFYTGLSFFVGSFLINNTFSNINIQEISIKIINVNDINVDGIGMFKILITFAYIILCFVCLSAIAYLSISYICGYSKLFNEKVSNYRMYRLILPVIPVIISILYIYFTQYHGVEQSLEILYDFSSELLKEFKSQL